jgi:hypothetical protein
LVHYAEYEPVERSSVWIQQEIAMFCYRMFLEHRSLPIRVYTEPGIRREGVTEGDLVNAIEFENSNEVVADVGKWLESQEYSEHPVVARRESLFRQRIEGFQDWHWLFLELLAAHSSTPGEGIPEQTLKEDFRLIQRGSGRSDPQIDELYRTARTTLRERGVIAAEKDLRTIEDYASIHRRWWDLVLEELRNQGRQI